MEKRRSRLVEGIYWEKLESLGKKMGNVNGDGEFGKIESRGGEITEIKF